MSLFYVNKGSNDIIVDLRLAGVVENVLQGDTVEIVGDRLVKSLPYGERDALRAAFALNRRVVQARHGRQAALRQPQNVANRVLIGRIGQLVAALVAAVGSEYFRAVENGNDLLQVFFGNVLPLGDVPQGDETVVLVRRQVKQEPQGAAALWRYLHSNPTK